MEVAIPTYTHTLLEAGVAHNVQASAPVYVTPAGSGIRRDAAYEIDDLGARVELAGGDYSALLHTTRAAFNNRAAQMEFGDSDGIARVDTVLPGGSREAIDSRPAPQCLGCGLGIRHRAEQPSDEQQTLRAARDRWMRSGWSGLGVDDPAVTPTAFAQPLGEAHE